MTINKNYSKINKKFALWNLERISDLLKQMRDEIETDKLSPFDLNASRIVSRLNAAKNCENISPEVAELYREEFERFGRIRTFSLDSVRASAQSIAMKYFVCLPLDHGQEELDRARAYLDMVRYSEYSEEEVLLVFDIQDELDKHPQLKSSLRCVALSAYLKGFRYSKYNRNQFGFSVKHEWGFECELGSLGESPGEYHSRYVESSSRAILWSDIHVDTNKDYHWEPGKELLTKEELRNVSLRCEAALLFGNGRCPTLPLSHGVLSGSE